MGPFKVVYTTPPVKGALTMLDRLEVTCAEQLSFQGAMETFVFSQCLRMTDSRMAQDNTKSNHPEAECCIAIIATASPWTAVIGQHTMRQSIATKCSSKVLLNDFSALIGTGNKT